MRKIGEKEALKLITDTLDSEGWQIIEEYFKNILTTEYAGFMRVVPLPWRIWRAQRKITAYLDVIDSIYRLAKRAWHWDGYKSLSEAMGADIPEERQLFMKALEELRR